MQITDIVRLVNNKLAGEMLTYKELKPFLDDAIDAINAELSTIYPAFSELVETTVEYNFFPDKYIRSVVVPGAAWSYYVADEEGIATAQQYQLDFRTGLFIMLRDMLYDIPEEYRADSKQGSVRFTAEDTVGDRGLIVNGYNFEL